jgi:putative nucleotidyltransferase with HDIG domain
VEPLAPLGDAAWAVGGGLRDALMGRPVADLDVAVRGDAAAAAGELARAHGATRFRLSRAFGAWRVQGGRLPFHVDVMPLQGDTLEEDLDRRDLTVNALALQARGDGRVIDRHGGLADLRAGRLRLVSEGALADDPVRLLRLARLAEQLGFAVEPATAARARADAGGLWSAPGERLAVELARILRLPRPDRAFSLMDELGVLGALVPQLEESRGLGQSPYHHRDVLGHTLEVVERVVDLSADPVPVFRSRAPRVRAILEAPLADELTAGRALVLAALLHDIAKPATHAVTPEGRVTFLGHDRLGAEMADDLLRRLRTSTRLREHIVRCVGLHLPLGFLVHRTPLSLRQIDRYLRATAPAEVEIILLSAADRLATRGPQASESSIGRHLALAREMMDAHFALVDRGPVRPLVSGDQLAAHLGRAPGPWLAALLDALREEQVVGAVRTRDQALRFAARWAADLGSVL